MPLSLGVIAAAGAEIMFQPEEQGVCCEPKFPKIVKEAISMKSHQHDSLNNGNTNRNGKGKAQEASITEKEG